MGAVSRHRNVFLGWGANEECPLTSKYVERSGQVSHFGITLSLALAAQVAKPSFPMHCPEIPGRVFCFACMAYNQGPQKLRTSPAPPNPEGFAVYAWHTPCLSALRHPNLHSETCSLQMLRGSVYLPHCNIT